MKISAVIVIFGKSPHLKECLGSLKQSVLPGTDFDTIVIDNTNKNLGFSGGNNQGIKQALARNADAVLLLNDDTKVDPHAIRHLANALFSKSNIGMAVPKIYFYPGFEYHKGRYRKPQLGKVLWYAGGKIDWNNCIGIHRGVDEVDHGQYDAMEDVRFATGCCLLIKREVFEKIGFLDERYFLYLEDLDFNVRAKKAGYQIIYEPKAVVWHKNAQSSGSGSALHDYFFTRNRLLFGMTHATSRAKFALFREAMKLLISGQTWKKKAVVDFFIGRFGKGSFRN